ncbi:MAG: class I SAM-dependent methyltransferase [Bacilli bacterium]|nr:class I SAM-dependent methyltransferase [Bacilli bacterium]
MEVINDFFDYEIIDASNGQKYERWNNVYLLRPDPLVIWNNPDFKTNKLDATYIRSNKGGGYWDKTINNFTVTYKDLKFNLKQMGFKHTGLFPEQATNWNIMREKIKKSKREIKVLNLFAYTGGASIACLSAGASVVHVDSSRGMVDWAKENVKLNNLEEKPIRFIVDDCIKFVKREIRRGNKYDAIIMDPPSYGKGANGEVWSLEKNLFELVSLCQELLSDKPLFFMINSYSGLSEVIIENILKITNKKEKVKITSSEIGLPITKNNLILPCGIRGLIEYE